MFVWHVVIHTVDKDIENVDVARRRRRRRFELKAIIKEYELLRLTIKLRL